MKLKPILAIVFLIFVCAYDEALACRCVRPLEVENWQQKFPVIFIGKVTQIDNLKASHSAISFALPQEATFQVIEAFAGVNSDTIKLKFRPQPPGRCGGVSIYKGGDFLVFPLRVDGKLALTNCGFAWDPSAFSIDEEIGTLRRTFKYVSASRSFPSTAERRIPTVDDLINVKSLGGAQISPDGKYVAYTVNETDWKQDAFVTHIWLVSTATGKAFQLTRGEKSAGNPQWAPDSQWLAFTSNRIGDKNQIFAIYPDGGEAMQLTKAENGVNNFAWSEDGKSIAFTASDADQKATNDRKDHLGDFEVVRKEYAHSHLWTFDVTEALKAPVTGTQRTRGKEFSVSSFSWSPNGKLIAFSATKNPDLINGGTSEIYLYDFDGQVTRNLVAQPGPDNNPRWSPDGKWIVFSSAMGNPKFFHANSKLAVVSVDGGKPRSITDAFDEQPGLVESNADGIYFGGLQKTASHLFRVDPETGKIARLTAPDNLMAGGFSFTKDGKQLAFISASPTSLNEVYVSPLQNFSPRKLTSVTDQVKDFTLATREVISW